MAGKNSPDFVCGQILYCLKTSRLNYLVKETPYSAYITIRKKFTMEALNVENDVNNAKESEKDAEIMHLKEHAKDLETRLAQSVLQFEEMDLEKDKMTADMIKKDDEIEMFLKNENSLKKEITCITTQRDELKDLNDKVSNEKDIISKDLQENVMMLENMLESRDLNIDSLKEKLKILEENIAVAQISSCKKCDFDSKEENDLQKHTSSQHTITEDESMPSTSKCGECEYESDDETDLKIHMQSKHALLCQECDFNSDNTHEMKNHVRKLHSNQCKFCHENFEGKRKLETHMCRMHIQNPSFGDYYMKNWFVRDDCIRIFSDIQKIDIGMLHSEKCLKISRCSYLPHQLIHKTSRFVDDNYYTHMEATKYLIEGNINWNILKNALID